MLLLFRNPARRHRPYLPSGWRAEFREIEKVEAPVGSLDITMYRDDLATRKSQPVPQATDITFDIQNKIMSVPVDDVIFTGRRSGRP